MMKISYAITVCNEFVEIQKLIPFLLKNKRANDEVIVLFDSNNGDKSVEEYLRSHSINGEFHWIGYEFDGHFANMKNRLTEMCNGDYIFQIDADELPHEMLIENLPEILRANDIDVILVPRVNTVDGLTQEHIDKWRWNVNEKGWVNWPDMQYRIYRKSDDIKWVNKVHEVLEGFQTLSHLPIQEELALYHPKDIERQERQNNYYDTL
jgi:glycosyltransferase involved in cell wall biosynthesis